MRASDLMVRALEAEGVEYIFGIPGEENLDFLDSLRNSSIRLILTRHEQAAGFMAATLGRLTGKPGVCLSTLGPGATNFTTAVAYALLGGMPCVFLTGQKPIRKSKQGRFQIINVVAMMKPLTKFAVQIVDGNNIPYLIRESFRIAQNEKPGPVHLELPEDIAHEEVDRTPFSITEVSPPGASQTSLERALKMIRAAKRPILLLAAGANRNSTASAAKAFVEKTGIFFCTTQMGKGVIDERHPHCLGTTALSAGDYLHTALEQADLIINVGHDLSEKPPFFMKENESRQVIHMGFYQAEMDDVYFPHHEVIGCMTANLYSLGALCAHSPQWNFSLFHDLKKEIDCHLEKNAEDTRFPLVPQRLVHDVRAALADDAIISLDNGVYKIWFARNYRAHAPNTVLLDNALATMGAGLPVAIGAKLVHPERQVVALSGDGGFMMNSQELETAVRLGLDLVQIVLVDNAYGMIKWKQTDMGFKNWGLDFGNPDFVAYAESYGAKGVRIGACGELTPTLKRCLAEGGVHLIVVPVDYSENEKVLIHELRNRSPLMKENNNE